MERKFNIVGVHAIDRKIVLALKSVETPESKMRLEEVIEEPSRSPEDRFAMKVSQAFLEAFGQMPGMPQAPSPPTIRLELTEDEYRDVGSPTVHQTVVLEFSVTLE